MGPVFFFGLFVIVLLLPIVAEPFDWWSDRSGPLANTLAGFGDAILSLTPAWLSPHVQAAIQHPLFIIVLILAYLGLSALNDIYQDAIQYHARRAWNVQAEKGRRVADVSPGPLSRFVRWLRNSPARLGLIELARPILPLAYTLAFIVLPALILANRAGFNYLVGRGSVCEASNNAKWLDGNATQKKFQTNDPCWASSWMLERGAAYRLTISVDPEKGDAPWLDQLIMTDPYGFDSPGIVMKVFTVARRWPSAAWFHPIARIGANGKVEWPLVPVDGGGALASRGRRCTRLPIRYDETPEHEAFCKLKPNADSCRDGMGLSPYDAVPSREIAAARCAWNEHNFILNGRDCSSPFPRKIFVSEFIARDAGEFFLFVNDAVHIAWPGRAQIFYANNSGTATITLELLPHRDTPSATASSAH